MQASVQQHLAPQPLRSSRLASLRPCQLRRAPRAGRKHAHASFNSSGATSDEFSRKASQFVSQQSRRFEKFVEETQINAKVETLADQVSRKAKDAFDRADKRMSLRTRARNAYLTAREAAPRLQRRAAAFLESPLGRVALVMAGLYALSSGLLLRAIHFALLALWVLPLFLPFIARAATRQKMEEAERMRQEAAAQQQQQRAWPFGGFGGGKAQGSAAGSSSASAGGGFWGGGRDGAGSSVAGQQPGGPIIDAEWTTVDD